MFILNMIDSLFYMEVYMKLIDLTGNRYGKLVVIKRHECNKNGHPLWDCICDCGNTKVASGALLRMGRVKSCGCLLPEANYCMNVKHGMSDSHLYAVWNSMKGRCYNPNNCSYKRYGARGITVCKEWIDFEGFSLWALSSGYKEGLSIDRIDNDGNYCPENCKWSTTKEQNNNRIVSLIFTHNGKTQNLSAWCEELNLPYFRTWQRIVQYGYSFEQAISLPVNKHRKTKG